MREQIRVMTVDDHEVVREGLRALLNRRPDMCVVGEANSVQTAVAEATRLVPDVIIMDVRLGDGSGVEACREIREEHPSVKVIMLTSYPDEEAVIASILAGAAGYLLKQTRGNLLAEAIASVSRGQSLLDPGVTAVVMERLRTGGNESLHGELSQLSGQEQRILGLIAEGLTNKEIAARLSLSHKTVKNYVSNILSKLGFRRRSAAAAFAARQAARHEPPTGYGAGGGGTGEAFSAPGAALLRRVTRR
ncbi:MAG: response regulator [Dehalococcoidia bacterium]